MATTNKYPQAIFDAIFAFPPNRETMGGTAYLIVGNQRRILVDCPNWNPVNQEFLIKHGPVDGVVITHRGGIGESAAWQQQLNCPILIQEQEAYLLPGQQVIAFADQLQLEPGLELIWTPGHSPGSSCLYCDAEGGILFTGRHLLANSQGQPLPLRTAKTFHWFRQLQSVQLIRDRFSHETLNHLCPGANTGFLRGAHSIAKAYEQLAQLDLQALRQTPMGM